ncbi:MAG: PLP-dependent aspartate aminotransferase family protein, partial [Firmicutes bacterium]|nr:PLP-dependent aspartate aminotransferase family protein [Bacillota bacterium]
PTLQVSDIRAISQLAHAHDAIVMADNTFMSPYLQNPLDLGCDLVIHSASKFLAGHSDVIAGVVVAQGKELSQKIGALQKQLGGILGPQDSWLTLRGLKTLGLRMDQEQRNAQELAQFLEKHPLIEHVYYPGLVNHPGASLQRQQARGAGAVLSVVFRPEIYWPEMVRHLRYAIFAVSLGGVETIVSHPSTMSHSSMPLAEQKERHISSQLLRISAGIEDTQDLIEDFSQALEYVR